VGIIGSSDASVYIFSLDTGAVKQTLRTLSAVTSVPVAVGEFLYVFDHKGFLYSFRAETKG